MRQIKLRKVFNHTLLACCCFFASQFATAQVNRYTDEVQGLLFCPVPAFLVVIGQDYAYFLQLEYELRDVLAYSGNIPLSMNFNAIKLSGRNSITGTLSVRIENAFANAEFRTALFASGFKELSPGEFWQSTEFTGERILVEGEIPMESLTTSQELRVYSYGETSSELKALSADERSVMIEGTSISPLIYVQKLNVIPFP